MSLGFEININVEHIYFDEVFFLVWGGWAEWCYVLCKWELKRSAVKMISYSIQKEHILKQQTLAAQQLWQRGGHRQWTLILKEGIEVGYKSVREWQQPSKIQTGFGQQSGWQSPYWLSETTDNCTQHVWIYCHFHMSGCTPLTSLALVWFEEAGFGTVQGLMHEHKHRCTSWTWIIITRINPPCIINKSRNVRGCLWPKRHKICHKKVSESVMFSLLISIVLWPRYD